jgi:hypothetical protein
MPVLMIPAKLTMTKPSIILAVDLWFVGPECSMKCWIRSCGFLNVGEIISVKRALGDGR